MGQDRRRYSREYKLEAVRMVTEGGHRVSQVAADLGIGTSMLRRWRREFEADPEAAFPGEGKLKPSDEDLTALRRELRRVREERDILKKALAIFSSRKP